MRNKNRAFPGIVLAGACLLAGPAHAVTVVPNVTGADGFASSSGQVPDPDPNNRKQLLVEILRRNRVREPNVARLECRGWSDR